MIECNKYTHKNHENNSMMNEKNKKIQYFGQNIENLSKQTHNYALTTKQTQSQIHKTKNHSD